MTPRPLGLLCIGIALSCGASTGSDTSGGGTSSSGGGASSSSGGASSSSGGASSSSGGTSSSSGGASSSSGGTSSSGGGAAIIWRDDIQGTSAMMGFDGFGIAHPMETGWSFPSADANGANVSRVPNPIAGGGYAMRHYANFEGGARAQAGIHGLQSTVFSDQARRPEGVWVAMEWYFPEAIRVPSGAANPGYCWINMWDFHSHRNNDNRFHTNPGLFLAKDGSMKFRFEWGNNPYGNPESAYSTVAMPVGRWFDIEVHYEQRSTKTGKLQVWIDGALALQLTDVQTAADDHDVVDTFVKWYGSNQGVCSPSWSPSPTIKYTRNVRVAGERIWRG